MSSKNNLNGLSKLKAKEMLTLSAGDLRKSLNKAYDDYIALKRQMIQGDQSCRHLASLVRANIARVKTVITMQKKQISL